MCRQEVIDFVVIVKVGCMQAYWSCEGMLFSSCLRSTADRRIPGKDRPHMFFCRPPRIMRKQCFAKL
ncbi:hypothetical protein FCULG_00012781 [Fusarium culmorum]|uniref:Uncharacterized protein n=1 Tax=Fusarium culmorum TaxID=5516 RepID=A0A2T4GIT1_FUSCU|nr:hypothetical protein FCULG_00012781 [Fusarium culmorum]